MPEITTTQDITLKYEMYNSHLNTYQKTNIHTDIIIVNQCKTCIDKTTKQGYDVGYDEARNEYEYR
jgi:hypothetical protein